MKKLMIAAAIVCAAVISQAAATKWQANTSTKFWYDGYNNQGGTYTKAAITTGPMVYLIAATADSANYTSQADLVDAFQNATAENPFNLADYAVNGSAGATLTTAGKLTGSGHKIDAFVNNGDFLNATSYDFYLATLVTVEGKDYLYVSDFQSVVSGASDTQTASVTGIDPATTSQAFYGDAEFSNAGWYTTASVPEPTSGLLLLLGMAGLALRRRRA